MRARLVLTALEQFEEPAVYEDEAGEQVADEGVDCVVVNHHEPPVVPLQRAQLRHVSLALGGVARLMRCLLEVLVCSSEELTTDANHKLRAAVGLIEHGRPTALLGEHLHQQAARRALRVLESVGDPGRVADAVEGPARADDTERADDLPAGPPDLAVRVVLVPLGHGRQPPPQRGEDPSPQHGPTRDYFSANFGDFLCRDMHPR